MKTILFITFVIVLIIGFIFLSRTNNPEVEDTDLTIPLLFEEFKNKIENEDSFILVVVQAGCPACKAFQPTLNSVIEQYDIDIYSIDTITLTNEERLYLNNIANVASVPTTLFIVNGIEETTLNRIVGNASQTDLVNRLRALNYIERE